MFRKLLKKQKKSTLLNAAKGPPSDEKKGGNKIGKMIGIFSIFAFSLLILWFLMMGMNNKQ